MGGPRCEDLGAGLSVCVVLCGQRPCNLQKLVMMEGPRTIGPEAPYGL